MAPTLFPFSPTMLAIVGGVLVVGVLAALSVKEWRRAVAQCLLVVGILGVGVVAALSFLPYGSRVVSPGPTPAARATNKMKQIALGTIMYADDHENQLPADLGQTFPYVGSNGDLYVVRRSGTSQPKSGEDVKGGQTDILYFGAGMMVRTEGAARILVATTSPAVFSKSGFVCAAYLDGHVECHQSVVPQNVKDAWAKAGVPVPLSQGQPE